MYPSQKDIEGVQEVEAEGFLSKMVSMYRMYRFQSIEYWLMGM